MCVCVCVRERERERERVHISEANVFVASFDALMTGVEDSPNTKLGTVWLWMEHYYLS